MNKQFNQDERDLVKLAGFFKKQSIKLMEEGTLGDEHKKIEEAVDRFLEHLENHVNMRAFIFEQREYLNKLVKDNAQCPKCHSSEKLKIVGTEKNEKGWKSNRYKCRKCNIEFTWNMPNNPWHMIQYIEDVLQQMTSKADSGSDEDKALTKQAIDATYERFSVFGDQFARKAAEIARKAEQTKINQLFFDFAYWHSVDQPYRSFSQCLIDGRGIGAGISR